MCPVTERQGEVGTRDGSGFVQVTRVTGCIGPSLG
jgi:hypothetical protein